MRCGGRWRKAEEEEWRRPDAKIFLCIFASAADAALVNPNGIKTLLANGLITFFISGNPVFSNGPRSIPRNHPDCIILNIWVFDIWYHLMICQQKLYEDLQLAY